MMSLGAGCPAAAEPTRSAVGTEVPVAGCITNGYPQVMRQYRCTIGLPLGRACVSLRKVLGSQRQDRVLQLGSACGRSGRARSAATRGRAAHGESNPEYDNPDPPPSTQLTGRAKATRMLMMMMMMRMMMMMMLMKRGPPRSKEPPRDSIKGTQQAPAESCLPHHATGACAHWSRSHADAGQWRR